MLGEAVSDAPVVSSGERTNVGGPAGQSTEELWRAELKRRGTQSWSEGVITRLESGEATEETLAFAVSLQPHAMSRTQLDRAVALTRSEVIAIDVRAAVLEALCESPESVPEVLNVVAEWLRAADRRFVIAALLRCIRLGPGARALENMIGNALGTKDAGVSMFACAALGSVMRARSSPPEGLIAACEAPDWGVRCAALVAMWERWPFDEVVKLRATHALLDENPHVRETGADVLRWTAEAAAGTRRLPNRESR
jgi:hypothetical protein